MSQSLNLSIFFPASLLIRPVKTHNLSIFFRKKVVPSLLNSTTSDDYEHQLINRIISALTIQININAELIYQQFQQEQYYHLIKNLFLLFIDDRKIQNFINLLCQLFCNIGKYILIHLCLRYYSRLKGTSLIPVPYCP